ncbi:PIN domain-containing protein [Candidatus Micrarchaeota archaeon]|nr:PIN domain-containing protein [Candidatus Micrarchaeota archaeon]
MVLLDTSAIIDLGRGNRQLEERINRMEKAGEQIKVPSPAIFELAAGGPARLDEKRRMLLRKMQSVPFNEEHAEAAAIIYRDLREKGSDIGIFDSMIAAVAIKENEPVMTRNVKHFKRIRGIIIEEY